MVAKASKSTKSRSGTKSTGAKKSTKSMRTQDPVSKAAKKVVKSGSKAVNSATKAAKIGVAAVVGLSLWGRIWRFIVAVAIPVAGGSIVAALTKDSMNLLDNLNQPALLPPNWVFPVAWTILYILMGWACYKVWTMPWLKKVIAGNRMAFMVPYFIQLALNFAWTLIFFVWKQYWVAFGVLIVMAALVLWLLIWTSRNRKSAMFMLLPYFVWLCFAGYLNCAIAIMN